MSDIRGDVHDHRSRPYWGLSNHPTKKQVEEMAGCHIPDEIWDFQPWGARLLVKRDLPEEMHKGLLYIPEEFRGDLHSGIIIKVGGMVGIDGAAQSGVLAFCPYSDPADLIGLSVIFGEFVGKVLFTSEDQKIDPYRGHWLLMTEEDIWGHSNREPEHPASAEE